MTENSTTQTSVQPANNYANVVVMGTKNPGTKLAYTIAASVAVVDMTDAKIDLNLVRALFRAPDYAYTIQVMSNGAEVAIAKRQPDGQSWVSGNDTIPTPKRDWQLAKDSEVEYCLAVLKKILAKVDERFAAAVKEPAKTVEEKLAARKTALEAHIKSAQDSITALEKVPGMELSIADQRKTLKSLERQLSNLGKPKAAKAAKASKAPAKKAAKSGAKTQTNAAKLRKA